jgi:hypothetical protein
MSRAAPGVFARGKLRRNFAEYCTESAAVYDRCWSKCPYRQGMGILLHPCDRGSTKCGCFTLHLSGIGVGCGRLGEVVSLVGDCRPPPPGNPHRPTKLGTPGMKAGSGHADSCQEGGRARCFSSKKRDSGGVFSLLYETCTFNKHQQIWNLKIFRSTEFFKIKHSSFYCTWKKPVLEFEHLHSHLCGSMGVKPLSIAITNVLEMQE